MMTMDDVELLFSALPDEDQVRFLERIFGKLHVQESGYDQLCDALFVHATDVVDERRMDADERHELADEIIPFGRLTKEGREQHRLTRDAILDRVIERVQRLAA
jgi:hypothetical protein